MNRGKSSKVAAFGLIDLIVIVGTVALAVFLILPALAKPRVWNCRIKCVSQLKYVGLAYQLFANDNEDHFPFHVPALTNEHTGTLITSNLNAQTWMHFQLLSNELTSPKVLLCPDDSARRPIMATGFLDDAESLAAPSKRDRAVSYFVGVFADERNPQAIISGDRNLASAPYRGPHSSWEAGGAVAVEPASAAWSRKHPMHEAHGHIALADGSAAQVNTPKLHEQLKLAEKAYGANINTFLFPQ